MDVQTPSGTREAGPLSSPPINDSLISARDGVQLDHSTGGGGSETPCEGAPVTVGSEHPDVEVMEVCNEVESWKNEELSDDVSIVTESSKPQPSLSTITVTTETTNRDEPSVTVRSLDGEVERESSCNMAQSGQHVDSESMSESCQPGPASIDAVLASSSEVDPGNWNSNEPASQTEAVVSDKLDKKDIIPAGDGSEGTAIPQARDKLDGASESVTEQDEAKPVPTAVEEDETEADLKAEATTGEDVVGSQQNSGKQSETEGLSSLASSGKQSGFSSLASSTDSDSGKQNVTRGPSSLATSADSEQSESEGPASLAISADSDSGKQSETEGLSSLASETSDATTQDVSPTHTLKQILALPVTPTSVTVEETQLETLSSPKTTPGGILRHTSQFDTPTSAAGRGRRVQFASSPVVFQPTKGEKEGTVKTPRPCELKSTLYTVGTCLVVFLNHSHTLSSIYLVVHGSGYFVQFQYRNVLSASLKGYMFSLLSH